MRVPRTKDEISALVREEPDGWEYFLYAGAMLIARDDLEEQYRDHLIGYAPLEGDSLGQAEAIQRLEAAFPDAQALVGQVDRLFNTALQERAFGSPGESGDEALIRQLSARTMDMYRGLMNWARGLRSCRVPSEFRTAYHLAADLVNKPIEQIRGFVDELVVGMDSAAERLGESDGEDPVEVTLVLTVSIEEGATDAFTDELKRLEARLV